MWLYDRVANALLAAWDSTLEAFNFTNASPPNGEWVTSSHTYSAIGDLYIPMDGYTECTIEAVISATSSFKVLAANAEAGTAATAATYSDISQYGVEILTAAATAATYSASLTTLRVKGSHTYLHIPVSVTTGTVTFIVKRLWGG